MRLTFFGAEEEWKAVCRPLVQPPRNEEKLLVFSILDADDRLVIFFSIDAFSLLPTKLYFQYIVSFCAQSQGSHRQQETSFSE
ncbi:unnamed protein product [Caenorhabditis auriculariae]|uniref:Uncharacterized protein n=1 Tax=Caenorhabditis auriculariae TaxID=2777116 RepID=A0A8S1GU70_9PELO|nr:unnamed protein product [Caenorhabditis auriculariae]